MRRLSLLPVLLALCLAAACDAESDPPPTPTPTPAGDTTTGGSPGAPVIALDLIDSEESDRARDRLASAGYQVTIADGLPAPYRISDRPDGNYRYVVEYWGLVGGQWSDVFEVTSDDVRRVIEGEVTDWRELGGASRPLDAYLAAESADAIREALDLGSRAGAELPQEELVERLHDDDSVLAILPLAALEPGIQAIEVDGHDPYRHPWQQAPFRLERSIDAPSPESADEIAATLMWDQAGDVRPLAAVATGELLPVRCSTPMLEQHGYDAMFDEVRDYFERADLVMTQLDASLTDHPQITPCADRPLVLDGSHENAAAMRAAQIDVVFAVGNHVGDCYHGCPAAEAVLETRRHLEEAGLVAVGLGEDLDAARAPHIMELDGMTIAFLAYDVIASDWYAAGPANPGVAPGSPDAVAEDVAAAAEQADHVIVGMSWSQREYVAEPDQQQLDIAEAAMEAGASLIVGNHPHWVQAIEYFDHEDRPRTVTFYSLGNFVFDQDWSDETQQTAFVEIGLLPDRVIGFRLRPAFVEQNFQPTPVSPATGHGREIFERTREASRALAPRQP